MWARDRWKRTGTQRVRSAGLGLSLSSFLCFFFSLVLLILFHTISFYPSFPSLFHILFLFLSISSPNFPTLFPTILYPSLSIFPSLLAIRECYWEAVTKHLSTTTRRVPSKWAEPNFPFSPFLSPDGSQVWTSWSKRLGLKTISWPETLVRSLIFTNLY